MRKQCSWGWWTNEVVNMKAVPCRVHRRHVALGLEASVTPPPISLGINNSSTPTPQLMRLSGCSLSGLPQNPQPRVTLAC